MKPKIKRRKVLKFIRAESEKLLPETYYALEKFYKPKWSDADKEWKVGVVAECKVNLYRRVKKIYDAYGFSGLNAFIIVKNEKKIKQDAEKISN